MKVLAWELRKLRAQTRVRLALLVCLLGPPLLAVVLGAQSGLPKDTLFGRHVHDSGFALPLLVLGFAGMWAFPLLTSIVAGDIFAAEDELGTWCPLLTRSRSRAELFTGKVLASVIAAVVMLTAAAVSSLLSGLALAGTSPLIGLSGTELSAGRATVLVLLSWASVLPPLLAFTALSCLISILSRKSVIGIGGPLVLGLLMQLLSLLGALGFAAGLLLTTPFAAWHGIVRENAFYGPLWQGLIVSVVWAAVSLFFARRYLLRRDIA